MAKKEIYKQQNLEFLEKLAGQEGVVKHPAGIWYKVLQQGEGKCSPQLQNIVTVHYRGTLINGREFDNSWKRGCPEAFRLSELIEGWQIALRQMCVGDRWMIYVPYSLGYGSRTSGSIPAFSTLQFEIELCGIA